MFAQRPPFLDLSGRVTARHEIMVVLTAPLRQGVDLIASHG